MSDGSRRRLEALLVVTAFPTLSILATYRPGTTSASRANDSVNDLVVEQLVDLFEVRDFQRAHGLDGHIQGFVGTTSPALLA